MQTLKINNIDTLKLNLSESLKNVQMFNRSFFTKENLNIENLNAFYTDIYNKEKNKGVYNILSKDTVIVDIGCGLGISTLVLNNIFELKTVYLLDLWDSWDSYGINLRSTVTDIVSLNENSNVKLVNSLSESAAVDVIISRASLGWDLGDDVFNATLQEYLESILSILKPNGYLIFESNNNQYELLTKHFDLLDISPFIYLGNVSGSTIIAKRKDSTC
jgi:SAM-dependent methyltransferase